MNLTKRLLPNRRTQPSASRWVRLVIWVLFIAAGASGVVAVEAQAPVPVPSSNTHPAVAAGTFAADDDTVLPATFASGSSTLDVNSSAYEEYLDSPKDLLPAYRWGRAVNLQKNLGFTDAASDTLGQLGVILFTVASFMWAFNLALLSFADQVSVLNEAAGQVNAVYANIASNLWPILILAYLVVLLRGAREIIKGNPMAMWRFIIGFIIPVAFMVNLAGAASAPAAQSSTKGSDGRAEAFAAKGTPAWYADRLTSQIDSVGMSIAGAFQSDGGGGALRIPGGEIPHCQTYIRTVENSYRAFSEASDSGSGGASLFASRMWALTMLEPWSIAALGDQQHRHKASCHLLEWQAGTDPLERQELARLAFGHTFHESVFRFTSRNDVGRPGWTNVHIRMSLWTACTTRSDVNNFFMNPAGRYALRTAGDIESDKAERIGNELCEQWADPNRGVGVVDGSGEDIKLDLENTHHEREKLAANSPMRQYLNAITGHNPMDRLTMGLVAFVGSAVYLFAFAGASIGLLLAKIGLVLALMVLPFTLTMIGLQMEQGKKLLRWTASMCAVELVFTMLLGVMFQMTQIGVTLVGGYSSGSSALGGGVEAGFFRMLLISTVPIVVLFAMNALLKRMGLGKITSPGGALGLVTGASSKAFKSGDGFSRLNNSQGALRTIGSGIRGAANLGRRFRDPFNTGVAETRRNARDVAKRAQKGLASEKEVDQAFSKYARAKDERRDKLRSLAVIPAILDRREGKKAYDAEEERWKQRNLKHLGGGPATPEEIEDAQQKELDDWRSRTQNYNPQTEMTRDPIARARAQEELHNNLIHDTQGLGPGDPSRPAIAEALLQQELARAGAAQLGTLDSVDLGDPSSAILPPTLREELRLTAAARIGIDPNHVVLDHYGNALVDPTSFGSWSEIPIELRGRPELHLDPSMWDLREFESQADLATRISGTLVATGHMETVGNQVVIHEVQGSVAAESIAGQAMWAQLGEAAINRAVLDAVGRINLSSSSEGQLMAGAAASGARIDSNEIAAEVGQTLGLFLRSQNESTERLNQTLSEMSAAARSLQELDTGTVGSVIESQIAALSDTLEDRIQVRTAQGLATVDSSEGTDAIVAMLEKIEDRERHRTEELIETLRKAHSGGDPAAALTQIAQELSGELDKAARAAREVEEATRRALDSHAAGGLRTTSRPDLDDASKFSSGAWSPF